MSAPKAVLAITLVGAAIALGVTVLDGRGETAPVAQPSNNHGAVRAATAFLVGLDAKTLLDRDARERFVTRWSTDSAGARLQRLFEAEARRMDPLRHGYARAAPMGYRVLSVQGRTAHVAVWAMSVASVGDGPPAVGGRTIVVRLEHEGGRWKVANVRETPGPSLELPAAAFRARARRFKEYRVAP